MIVAGTSLASSETARAGIVLASGSTATTTFELQSTTASGSSSGATFANGVLISPGAGFPSLTGLLDDSTFQSGTQAPISTNFVLNATSDPTSSTGYVPSSFGSATTDVLATAGAGNGTSAARGGLMFFSDTTLADNLAGTSGVASVSITTARATFTNTGTTAVNIRQPGSLISVTGTLGSATSSYVAAGLSSSFTLSTGGGPVTLGPIALAANANGTSTASTGIGGAVGSASLISGLLSATGSSMNPTGQISLAGGTSITFTATLTLISDPGSSISISSTLAPGFPTDPQYIPDFGVFAFGPAVAPEPSTIVMMGAGLASVGLWARRRSRSAR